MEYRIIIQGRIDSTDAELIGAKEAVADALEIMGCDVDYIKVMPEVAK